MKKFLLALCCIVLFSCTENIEQSEDSNIRGEKSYSDLHFSRQDKLREKFGTALVQALSENESLRTFIRVEALKQFNKDYDVLYNIVKDKPLRGGQSAKAIASYSSFRELLITYFDSEAELLAIESELPLLTIFIPKLPENGFSAENWNTSDPAHNPAVAIRMDDENETPIIFNKTDTYVLDGKYIPDFPVVVLKDNERVITNFMNGYDDMSTSIVNTSGTLSYRFIDQNLDPMVIAGDPEYVNTQVPVPISTPPSFDWAFIPGRENTVTPNEIAAYNAFEATVTNPWHRDNMYFGLTTAITTGKLSNKYKESITYIKFEGVPSNVYNTISQRSPGNPDPQIAGYVASRDPGPAWTDGNFEFYVWCTHGSKTDADGTNTRRVFTASPEQVFETHYSRERIDWWTTNIMGIWRWIPYVSGNKPMDFVNGFNGQKLIFYNWDLSVLANQFNFKFEEADIAVTNEQIQAQSTKHNQNVNFDASTGDKVKVGIKYGASTEWTESTSRKFNWTTSGANFLGQQTVNFKDNVVNKHPVNNKYYPAIHSTGIVTFESRPLQVNF